MSDIFLSFSGEKSQEFAEELEKLIKEIDIGETFLSNNDIKAGNDWLDKISIALQKSRLGIVIFTKENRDNNKWLYLEYGVLSYKVLTRDRKNLNVIPLYLDFTEKEWDENPLNRHQSISLASSFQKEIVNLCLSINKTIGIQEIETDDDTTLFRESILKSQYITSLEKIINSNNSSPVKTNTTSKHKNLNINQNDNITLHNERISDLLLKINNYIIQNPCNLYKCIEYNKLEKYLEEESLDELALFNTIANLSDNKYLVFNEEYGVDGYPTEYISLSIQGQTVIRRRKRNN